MAQQSQPPTNLAQAHGIAFERATIALLLSDSEFALAVIGVLTPTMFESPVNALVFTHAKRVFDSTKRAPSRISVNALLIADKANGVAKAVEDIYDRAIALLAKLGTVRLTVGDSEFIKQRVGTFVQRACVRSALIEAVEHFERGDIELAVQRVLDEKLRTTSLNETSAETTLDVFNSRDKFQRYVKKVRTAGNCPLGLPKLDSYMRGGIEVGNLALALGPPGRGKTRFLVHAGATAAARGMKVLHVTLELSAEDIGLRYDARLTGIPVNDILKRTKQHALRIHRVTEALRAAGGAIRVKQWAPGDATVNDIAGYISQLHDEFGAPVDLVIVDYVDLLKPVRGDDRWEQHGLLVRDLKRLAVRNKTRVWSASQSTRASFTKKLITLDDIADTIEKVRIADVVIGLCQTMAEKRSQKMRFALLKNRLGGNEGRIVDCIVRDDVQTIQEDIAATDTREAGEEEDY